MTISRVPHIFKIAFLISLQSWGQHTGFGTISEATLTADSKEFIAYSSGPTAEQAIQSGTHYDVKNKTYLLTYHPHEEKALNFGDSDPLFILKSLALNSDAVILATPRVRQSALNEGHHFVFSDYLCTVDAVYVDHTATIAAKGIVVVGRAGGEISLNGVAVRAVETEFPLFRLDKEYIFFLHKLPSGSFLVNPSDAFRLDSGVLIAGRNHPLFDSSKYSLNHFVSTILTTSAGDTRGIK